MDISMDIHIYGKPGAMWLCLEGNFIPLNFPPIGLKAPGGDAETQADAKKLDISEESNKPSTNFNAAV